MEINTLKPPKEMSDLEIRLRIIQLRKLSPIIADPGVVADEIQRLQTLLDSREKESGVSNRA